MRITTESDQAWLKRTLEKCRTDYVRFNRVILGRSASDKIGNRGYWSKQKEICESVVSHPVTLVPTGNAVGKSHVAAGILHSFLFTNDSSLVIATAPTQVQLEEVLWKEVERAYRGSRIPLGGRLLKSPLKVDLGGGWQALAYSTTKTERFSGHHGEHVLAIADEASGVQDEIKEAIDSLNPSRFLAPGNPLRPDGWFYESCTRAQRDPSGLVNVIQISSLESPHIHLERSPWGLADATWLAKCRNDYGENSLWWTTHVLGLFPDSAADNVIPSSWLDLAAAATHVRGGVTRTAIDLAEGNGGDKSVVITRDNNGILQIEHSNTWKLETTAQRAALQVQRWGVEHNRVSFDVAGIGSDFNNRLEAVGIRGAQPYRGGAGHPKAYGNLRSSAAWNLRKRLDPGRMDRHPQTHELIPQVPFSIRPEWVKLMRQELQGLRYELDTQGRICLEVKEDFAARLRHSPDFADCLTQTFAFPGT